MQMSTIEMDSSSPRSPFPSPIANSSQSSDSCRAIINALSSPLFTFYLPSLFIPSQNHTTNYFSCLCVRLGVKSPEVSAWNQSWLTSSSSSSPSRSAFIRSSSSSLTCKQNLLQLKARYTSQGQEGLVAWLDEIAHLKSYSNAVFNGHA